MKWEYIHPVLGLFELCLKQWIKLLGPSELADGDRGRHAFLDIQEMLFYQLREKAEKLRALARGTLD